MFSVGSLLRIRHLVVYLDSQDKEDLCMGNYAAGRPQIETVRTKGKMDWNQGKNYDGLK